LRSKNKRPKSSNFAPQKNNALMKTPTFKKWELLFLAALFIFMACMIFIERKEEKSLYENFEYTNAVIIEFYRFKSPRQILGKDNYRFRYVFSANDVTYKGKGIHYPGTDTLWTGSVITVMYDTTNPKINIPARQADCQPQWERMKENNNKDISDPTNTLNGKTETLNLQYIVWGCVCANWITLADYKKYQDSALAEHCIFIEPASEDLKLPTDFDPFEQFIQVTGQFYLNPDYPKGTKGGEQQPLNKAKVFRYTKIKTQKTKQK
jgi:hypothetical protein